MVKHSVSVSTCSGSSGMDGIFSSLELQEPTHAHDGSMVWCPQLSPSPRLCISLLHAKAQRGASRVKQISVTIQLLHLGGCRWPWLLHIELSRTLHLAMGVPGGCFVLPFIFTAHVHNDQ